MPIITITRGKYSGGEQIAENIAKMLGARCVNEEVLRDAARNYRASEERLADFFEKDPTWWERLTKHPTIYAIYIKATLLDMCEGNALVYHGNAGQELLRDVPHALKARLMLSFRYRAARIMEELGKTREEAEELVQRIDDERTKRTRYYYDADWRDSSRYDLMIRMDGTKPPFVEETLLAMIKQPRYQLTEENAGFFKDLVLQARLHALAAMELGRHVELLDLSVHDKVATLEGSFPQNAAMKLDKLLGQLRNMPEIVGVNNKISAGLVVIR